MAAKVFAIGAEHNPVCAFLFNTDAIVGEAIGRMEVEDPQEASPLEHDDLVNFVLQANEGLGRMEPAVLLLCPLHLAIKLVQKSVAEKMVIHKIKLPSGVVEAVVVPLSRKI